MAWKYVQYDEGKYRTTDQGGGGGEENVIESISLNGVDVPPDANKNVALTVIDNTVNNLVNYYLKSETYTQAQVDNLINAAKTGRFIVVAVLPTTNIDTTAIYLVPKMPSEQSNVKDEYINLDGTISGWEKIGDTTIDLSDYVTDTDLANALADYTPSASLATVATSGSYSDLSNKPTIPAAQVNSDWNASSGVAAILNKPTIPSAYTGNPAMDGTASPGDSTAWARGNHVHPSDTSKADETEVAAIENVYGSKNLLSNNVVTATINGVTFTINDDRSITANGTSTDIIILSINNNQIVKAGSYMASYGAGSAQGYTFVGDKVSDSSRVFQCYGGESVSFTLSADTALNIFIWIASGVTINDTFYPMIRDARIKDSTYVPYAMTNRELTEDKIDKSFVGVTESGAASKDYYPGDLLWDTEGHPCKLETKKTAGQTIHTSDITRLYDNMLANLCVRRVNINLTFNSSGYCDLTSADVSMPSGLNFMIVNICGVASYWYKQYIFGRVAGVSTWRVLGTASTTENVDVYFICVH